eukprot:421341_1
MADYKTAEESGYKSLLQWHIGVNHKEVRYGKGNRSATLIGKPCTIRGPWWDNGHHIVNLHVPIADHVGVGIVSKLFDISPGKWVGGCANSYGTWDCSVARHRGDSAAKTVKKAIKITNGAIVTIDVDLNKNVLNFEVNGHPFSDGPIFENIPNQVALAVSLWKTDNSVDIIQYQRV